MRIGVDFDGVLSDPSALKIEYARKYWGIDLKPEDCTTSKAQYLLNEAIKGFGADFLKKQKWNGKAEYTHLIRLLEAGPMLLQTLVVPYCKDVLETLRSEGHKIIIVTTFEAENSKWAYTFLEKNKIPYDHFISVPYLKGDTELKKMTKKQVVDKLKIDAFIDDSYYNLEGLSGTGIPLCLLDQPWNRHVKIKHSDVVRVKNWNEFYRYLKKD